MTGIFEPVPGAFGGAPATTGTKRQRQALSSTETLYRAALELFAQNGYDVVTVDDICARAGLTKGAFYAHFGSKHDIMLIQLRAVDEAQRLFLDQLPSSLPAREQIERFVGCIADSFLRVGFSVMRSLYLAELSPKMRFHYTLDQDRPVYAGLEALVIGGQERGEIRIDLPAGLIRDHLVRCIRGGLFESSLRGGESDLAGDVRSLVSVYLDGICAGA